MRKIAALALSTMLATTALIPTAQAEENGSSQKAENIAFIGEMSAEAAPILSSYGFDSKTGAYAFAAKQRLSCEDLKNIVEEAGLKHPTHRDIVNLSERYVSLLRGSHPDADINAVKQAIVDRFGDCGYGDDGLSSGSSGSSDDNASGSFGSSEDGDNAGSVSTPTIIVALLAIVGVVVAVQQGVIPGVVLPGVAAPAK